MLCLFGIALTSCNEVTDPTTSEPPLQQTERSRAGLFTTLPILWNETPEFGDLLSNGGDGEANPVRAALEQAYDIVPLDTLDSSTLDGLATVVLAQPRALSASENVALDAFVRKGGTVVLFADPMLTGHSLYALGDPRRPQDTVLLSPILTRWGLELRFDTQQEPGERTVEVFGIPLVTDMAGTFVRAGGENTGSVCEPDNGLAVACKVGEGRVYAIADAAALQPHSGGHNESGALSQLFSRFVR